MTHFSFSRKLVRVFFLPEPDLIYNSTASSLTTVPDSPHPCILPHMPELTWVQHLGPNTCLFMLPALNRLVLETYLPISQPIVHVPHTARWRSTMQVWSRKHPVQKFGLLSLPKVIPLKSFLISTPSLATYSPVQSYSINMRFKTNKNKSTYMMLS